MRTIWHSLAWKEWHEHKWVLAALTAVALSISATVLLTFHPDREVTAIAPIMVMLCFMPLTTFIAAVSATGERARGTLPFAQSLPIARWKVASQKVVFGLATCILPVVIATGVVLGWASFWPSKAADQSLSMHLPWAANQHAVGGAWWFAIVTSDCAAVIVSVFLWTAAIAVHRKDEVSGSAIALAAIAAAWTIAVTASSLNHVYYLPWLDDVRQALRVPIISALPGGFGFVLPTLDSQAQLTTAAMFAIVVHSALAARFLRRFGGQSDTVKVSLPPAIENAASIWLAPPRRSPSAAIIWKQLRDMGPALVTGIAAMLALLIGGLVLDWPEVSESHHFALMIAVFTGYVGFVVTLTIGIGVFLNDLSPKLNVFWRSRPINPDSWYWVRFCLVPIVLIATFGLPGITAEWWALRASDAETFLPWSAVFSTISTYVALYAASIAMTCLVRRAIYAAVLSIGALAMPYLIVWSIWWGAARYGIVAAPRSGPVDSLPPTAAFAILGLIALTTTLLGWLAVRYDWGRKN